MIAVPCGNRAYVGARVIRLRIMSAYQDKYNDKGKSSYLRGFSQRCAPKVVSLTQVGTNADITAAREAEPLG
jgi:hypothetical protein